MDDASNLRSKLAELASNIWWSWQPEVVGLFRDLDPERWTQVNHNPIAFLETLDDGRLVDRARKHALESRILGAFRRLSNYLDSRTTWGAFHAGALRARPVAYFSPEFGLHESLPLYSGGLGVLAGDHMKAASDLDVPLYGVGLFYVQGYFTQGLDASGWQGEEFGPVEQRLLPLERMMDPAGHPITVEIPCGKGVILSQLVLVRVGRCHLILLDADIEGNSAEHRQITHRLYWGDQSSRILQEIVLGIGGLRALRQLGVRPGVLHLNEGHSAFALLEAIRTEMEENACTFDDASHRVGVQSVFTTHTPVPAGHDRFPADLVEEHLGWMRRALGLDRTTFMGLGRVDPNAEEETFCMTVVALKLAHRANGVAALHGETSRQMWSGLWPERPVQEVPIGHITNGVHVPSWMAPQLFMALSRRLGPGWNQRTSPHEIQRVVSEFSHLEIWENHQVLKATLIDFVRRRAVFQSMRRGVPQEEAQRAAQDLLDPAALTLGFARRFATYKRATLLFRDRERIARLVSDPRRPVQFVFAGKAHPRDDGGKKLIQEIIRLQEDPAFRNRIVFVEDYDINVARHLVQGVDVWVNNPIRPEEACGTSGMKAGLNGALNLSIRDGWWAEASDGENGFDIPSPGPHSDQEVQSVRDHEALLHTLEQRVVPLFYDRGDDGLPEAWLRQVRWAFITLAFRCSADRMVMDYVRQAYLPAALGDVARP